MGRGGVYCYSSNDFRGFPLERSASVRHSDPCVLPIRIAVALSLLSFGASAEPEQPKRVRARVVLEAPSAARWVAPKPDVASPDVVTLADGALPDEASELEASEAPKTPRRRSCGVGSTCGYRALLAELVITRDFEIPGAEGVALRLFPTSRALAGDDGRAKFVLRPRVQGSASSYGLDLAARF